MIPRFIIKDARPSLLDKLLAMGYEAKDNPLTDDVLVLGMSLLNSTIVPDAKNPLIKVYLPHQDNEVLEQAELQKRWTNNTVKTELLLGDPKQGKVLVTTVGIMIDSFIVHIDVFRKLLTDINRFRSPIIASHKSIVNPEKPFLTVGCADYSLQDISTIISAYEKLLEPTP